MGRIPDSERRCESEVELYLGPEGTAGAFRATARVEADEPTIANATVLHLHCDRSRHADGDHGVVLILRGNADDLLYTVRVDWRMVHREDPS